MKLRQRRNPSGSISWQVDYGLVDGKRKMVSFGEDEDGAKAALEKAKGARKTHGDLGVMASPQDMAEFLAAKKLLGGVRIMTAVEFYLAKATRVRKAVMVPAAVEDYLWAMEERKMGKRSLETMRSTLNNLARWLPLRLVHELTAEDLRKWLRSQGWETATQNHRLGQLRTFLAWCRATAQGYAMEDPAGEVEMLPDDEDADEEAVGTLTVGQAEKLLLAALAEPVWMGYVVGGLLCGLRRCEMERTRWDRVSIEEGTIVIGKGAAKGRRGRRVVDLTENALAFLKAALVDPRAAERVAKNRTIAPSNLKEKWPLFWPKCGVAAWPNNALRHTFASMHYAEHQDEAKLQVQMGHVSAKMLHEHYRAIKTRKEAALFWALRPAVAFVLPETGGGE